MIGIIIFILIIAVAILIAIAKVRGVIDHHRNVINIADDLIAIDNATAYGGTDRIKDLMTFPASRFESGVRQIFERITGYSFPCVYPAWLKIGKKQYELDGYSAELKIAFECQGPQHSRYSKSTDANRDKYLQRLENDKLKEKICADNNVALIIIDYRVPKHLMSSYIKSRIFDVCETWKHDRYDDVMKLGYLSHKPGDYIDIINPKITLD